MTLPERMLALFPGDFGPSHVMPDAGPPRLWVINGQKPSQLRSEVRRLCPRKPGVYGMIAPGGELIYVGKAKNLRTRLLSYFRARSRPPRAGRIIRQSGSIAWETSPNEFTALLRELELIRRWRPHWNVQGQPLRRRLAYLCLGRPPAPYLFLSRRLSSRILITHAGPFPATRLVRQAVRFLNDHFQMRDCPQPQDMLFAEDGELFPGPRSPGCLRLEIGTCLGPCAAACTRSAYRQRVQTAQAFLHQGDDRLLKHCERHMLTAAGAGDYERAAAWRDKLDALRRLADKLTRLRQLRRQYSLVYPVRGPAGASWWYLLHGGRTVAVISEPVTAAEKNAAADILNAVYFQETFPATLESYEHVDGLVLVSGWFRRHPRELHKTLPPAEALRRCNSNP